MTIIFDQSNIDFNKNITNFNLKKSIVILRKLLSDKYIK